MSLVLCDDHDLFRDALAGALTSMGHRVLASTSDPEQLPGLVSLRQPRACLVDVSFHGRPRLDAAAALRESHPGTVVLLLTGAAPPPVWQAFDERVVDGVISKACDVSMLDAAIRRGLAGERVVEGWPGYQEREPADDYGFEPLTEREHEILVLIVEGVSTQMMAATLGVSSNTVRTHVQHVLRKLQVHHRSKAARCALDLGLV